jgi:hypothetical protein
MDGLIQIQVVVQANAGAVGVIGLDTQGRVWYGELSRRTVTRAPLHQVDKDRRKGEVKLTERRRTCPLALRSQTSRHALIPLGAVMEQ